MYKKEKENAANKRKSWNKTRRKGKEKKWKKVCAEVDAEPWGKGYQIVSRKIGANSRATHKGEELKEIARKLFPSKPKQK